MVHSSKISKTVFSQLHLDALPEVTRKAFLQCAEISFFSRGGWYLAGGSALALQTGHRRSIDLDFFTAKESFNQKKAEETLSVSGTWKTSNSSQGTLYGEFNGAKISLIAYPFFRVVKPPLKVGTISVIKPEDIGAMKITAISQRGKKRDFFDLYWLAINIQPLIKYIEAAQEQYSVRENMTHILKSLVYFDDAESDPNPEVYFKADWKTVKKFFQSEIAAIAARIIN